MKLAEKLKRNWIKYLFVLFPGIATLYIFLPIGDYSSGMAHGLGILFFSLLMMMFFIIVAAINIRKIVKRTERFDAIPIIITSSVAGVSFLALFSENQKFWTQTNLIAGF